MFTVCIMRFRNITEVQDNSKLFYLGENTLCYSIISKLLPVYFLCCYFFKSFKVLGIASLTLELKKVPELLQTMLG